MAGIVRQRGLANGGMKPGAGGVLLHPAVGWKPGGGVVNGLYDGSGVLLKLEVECRPGGCEGYGLYGGHGVPLDDCISGVSRVFST